MTPEQAHVAVKRLKASYPTMKPLDEITTAVYMEEIGALRWDDFIIAAKQLVQTSKFFPSVAEILEAADLVVRKRIEKQDHDEREERLAIKAADEAIMDPKSDVHRVVVGPNHQKFLDMLSGKIQLPEPEWIKRKREPAITRQTQEVV